MERYVSTIKGKKYWYLRDSIYINKGKTRGTTTSLGRVETATEQSLKIREEEFRKRRTLQEIHLRVEYWRSKTEDPHLYSESTMTAMETERSNLYRAKQDLGQHGNDALEMAFLVDFIYNSNKMEGSRVPRSEVRRLVGAEHRDSNEVGSTLSAMRMLNTAKEIDVRTLLKAHAALLYDEPAKHGLRKVPIMVGDDDSLCNPSGIPGALAGLLVWYRKNKHSLYPPELAFRFYYRFERIHPFEDGNGRIGRLLMNEILRRAKYHPVIVWDKRRIAHFSVFKKGADGRLRPFLRFMNDQYFRTYRTYTKKIGPALDFQKRVEFFLTPSES